jgi:hypothetical protein
MTDAEMERTGEVGRADNLARGPPSDFGPDTVLALVAEVRRLRAEVTTRWTWAEIQAALEVGIEAEGEADVRLRPYQELKAGLFRELTAIRSRK